MFQFEADAKVGERFRFTCPHCGEEITWEHIIDSKSEAQKERALGSLMKDVFGVPDSHPLRIELVEDGGIVDE